MRPRARGALTAGFLSLAPALAMGPSPARADVIVELGPTVTVGWTDNASATSPNIPPNADGFGTASGAVRGRYIGKNTEQSLGYRLSYTKYLHQYAPDAVTQEFSWVSTYALAPRWDLTAGASGGRSKTTAFVLQDESAAKQLAVAGANLDYLSFSVNEGLTYRPNARRRYVQSITASQLRYLSAEVPLNTAMGRPTAVPPNTTYVNATARAEWERARDLYIADFSVNDSYVNLPPAQAPLGRHRIMIQALGGYRRDFSLMWSADIALGGVMVLTTDLAGIIAPAGLANVSYRRLTWFATLTASQSAAPNIFIGAATLNDQVMARVSLPLTRSEAFVVSGNAGYTYARFASAQVHSKAYDLYSTGVSVYWHPERAPIWTALDYSYTNQNGSSSGQMGIIPSRERQAVMLTVGGSFVFGKGTPPIFRGAL